MSQRLSQSRHERRKERIQACIIGSLWTQISR